MASGGSIGGAVIVTVLCTGMIGTQYLYDAEGTRVAKGTITNWSAGCNTATNGFIMTTSYILGPGNEQLTELAWSGGVPKPAHTNVFAAGQLAATYSNSDPDDEPAGILYFQLTDWLGTRRVGTDSAGITAEVCHSLPFGDGEDCSPLAPTEHIFTGKERDAESGGDGGNDYFGARYYASSMGRFLSADWSAQAEPVPYAKMDNPQTLNLYAFVGNNPLRNVDADGHIAGDFAYDEFLMMEFQIKKEADAERNSHNQPAQQQSGGSVATGLATGVGSVLGSLSKAKEWFDRATTVKSDIDDAANKAGWQKVLTAAQLAEARDTNPWYHGPQGDPDVDRAAEGLATANIRYLTVKIGISATDTPIASKVAEGLLPGLQKQVNAAQQRYNQAWAAYTAELKRDYPQ